MSLLDEALQHFKVWLKDAENSGLKEPTAMALATSTMDGKMSVRMVLLKGVDDFGFSFYTNAESRKGQQLLANPRAALCFYWMPLDRQILIEGPVEVLSEAAADAYWKTRPRESQIGAWASQQSRPLDRRENLEVKYESLKKKYGEDPVPRPPYWKGFRLQPTRIEFWTAKPHRLHEREVYEKIRHSWRKGLLYP